MSIIDQLASSLQRRDEVPNQELAAKIAAANDKAAVQELIGNLQHKNKLVQHDCIKVLYETGERKPALISPFIPVFVALLSHKDNRLQWGGMAALDALAAAKPDALYEVLPAIVAASDKGSVITKDHCINILIRLAATPAYKEDTFTLLIEQLLKAATNQLPMYAENSLPLIDADNKAIFIKTLSARLPDIEKESKRKRVEKGVAKSTTFIMAFYDLPKSERVLLVAAVHNDITQDLKQGRLDKMQVYFSDEDTYIRKTAYLETGRIFLRYPALQPAALAALKLLLQAADFKRRQTAVNAAGK